MSDNTSLYTLGWNSGFEEFLHNNLQPGFLPGRISNEQKGSYTLLSSAGEVAATLAGRFHYIHDEADDFPSVGDWVLYTDYDEGTKGIIHQVMPRRTVLARTSAGRGSSRQVIAANIDLVFIVQGLDRDYNVRRLERYRVLCAQGGITPVVVLNKSDIVSDIRPFEEEVKAVTGDIRVIFTSAATGDGFDELREVIKTGMTCGLVGSSGVGKSSIINRLLGAGIQATADVRSSDSRGRHTTTSRQLFLLPDGGMVIDTPGMRELQLLDDDGALESAFDDIAALSVGCRYDDCTHTGEPGCAVRKAAEEGALDPGRYENYLKMRREMQYLASLSDDEEFRKRKAREKSLHREIKRYNKKERT